MGGNCLTYLYIGTVSCWIFSTLLVLSVTFQDSCEINLCPALVSSVPALPAYSACSSSCVHHGSCYNIIDPHMSSGNSVDDFEVSHSIAEYCVAQSGGANHLGLKLSWGISITGEMTGYQIGIAETTGDRVFCIEMKLSEPRANLRDNISLPCLILPNVITPSSAYDVTMKPVPSDSLLQDIGSVSIPDCLSTKWNIHLQECADISVTEMIPSITAYANRSVKVQYTRISSKKYQNNYTIYISNEEHNIQQKFQTLPNTARPLPELPHVWFDCVEPGEYHANVKLTDEPDLIIYRSDVAEVHEYDPCDGTCQNGGTCTDYGNCTATCTCSDCYSGDHCELQDKNCEGSSLLFVLLPSALVVVLLIVVLTVLLAINLSRNRSSKVQNTNSLIRNSSVSSDLVGNNPLPNGQSYGISLRHQPTTCFGNGYHGNFHECNGHVHPYDHHHDQHHRQDDDTFVPDSSNFDPGIDPDDCRSVPPDLISGFDV